MVRSSIPIPYPLHVRRLQAETAELVQQAGDIRPQIASPREAVRKAVQKSGHIAQGAGDAATARCRWWCLRRSVLDTLHNLFELGNVRISLRDVTATRSVKVQELHQISPSV